MADTHIQDAPPRDGPEGIGGWLILPVVMLVLLIVAAGLQLTLFSDVVELASSLPTIQRYIISAQIVFNALLGIICPIVLLVLLFQKKRSFPGLFVGWALVFAVFAVINRLAATLMFGGILSDAWRQLLSPSNLQSLILSILPVVIFIPYMLKSRRVRNTFVQ